MDEEDEEEEEEEEEEIRLKFQIVSQMSPFQREK